MSAPNQGRQSPEPARQAESQAGTQAPNPNDQNAGPGQKTGEQSKSTLENLSSNPKGPLDDEAEKKTAK